MIISNFAVVCREPGCHGRIQPEGSIHGKCAKCGMTTDEWERINRPAEWKARRQREVMLGVIDRAAPLFEALAKK